MYLIHFRGRRCANLQVMAMAPQPLPAAWESLTAGTSFRRSARAVDSLPAWYYLCALRGITEEADPMKILSLKLPDDLAQELSAQARSRGTTKSEVLRQALVDFLAKAPQPDKDSLLDRAGDLVGRLEGPEDLSYNKKYLDDYGR
jgi:Arc/MetJ-type ribon-helix-helix transcriptional regulator